MVIIAAAAAGADTRRRCIKIESFKAAADDRYA